MNDLKLAFRQLRKSPGFTLVAVLTLALGIGANTAIFSVVEGVLLRPLPFPNAERLVRIYEALDENGARSATLNLSDRTVARFREFGRDIFEDVAGGTGGASVVSTKAGSPAQTVPAALVTYNFFDVLGLPPSQGRNFTREEGSDKAATVAHHQRRLLAQHAKFTTRRPRQHDHDRWNTTDDHRRDAKSIPASVSREFVAAACA